MFEEVARPVYVIVALEPPTSAPKTPLIENGPENVCVVVATDESALVPLP
jgi:hypothetical protein